MTRAADERTWMERALALARAWEGMTRPNPPVGAVVVRDGEAVGEGAHERAGEPHAEPNALARAGARARGADLYVTLEPCSTAGRTPPCTEAVIRAGIRRVVVGARDPNPKHDGRGLEQLRRAGIRVDELDPGGACRELIEPFAMSVLAGRPLVTLKMAATLDGKIADRTGASKWITGPEAREEVQALRRRADGILVGVGTVAADDPSLWPRPDGGRRPVRIIADPRGETPPAARVLTDGGADRTWIAVTAEAPPAFRERAAAAGAEVIEVERAAGGCSLPGLLTELGRRGLMHVVCEGGGRMADALLRAGLMDRLVLYLAPSVLGGRDAPAAFDGPGRLLSGRAELEVCRVRAIGRDLVVEAKPRTT
jgi:diaminohydroxyphosphoribosylaminopyrimidine deaminase / 5-amino-6-(5-phosphoribosylamino)uracil reductase